MSIFLIHFLSTCMQLLLLIRTRREVVWLLLITAVSINNLIRFDFQGANDADNLCYSRRPAAHYPHLPYSILFDLWPEMILWDWGRKMHLSRFTSSPQPHSWPGSGWIWLPAGRNGSARAAQLSSAQQEKSCALSLPILWLWLGGSNIILITL